MDAQPIVAWAAPIASTLVITWLTALINRRMDESKKESESEAKERREWRSGVDRRLDGQDAKIEAILRGQTTQMRSDLIHKAHRYVDDLGCAGIEEKQAFWAEYEDYQRICDANNIVNHFVDQLAQLVMELPDRPRKD